MQLQNGCKMKNEGLRVEITLNIKIMSWESSHFDSLFVIKE